MRIMSLDVGSVTIGVAVSDLLGWTAQGVETIRHTTREKILPVYKNWLINMKWKNLS